MGFRDIFCLVAGDPDLLLIEVTEDTAVFKMQRKIVDDKRYSTLKGVSTSIPAAALEGAPP